MHILHIIATIDPKAGGPSEFVRALLTFGPADLTGEVLTLDDPQADFIRDFPFPIHALGPITSVYGYNAQLKPWLERNRDRFDGVILNGLWVYCGVATRRAFRGRKPYMVFPHGMLDPYFKRRFPRKHLKKWFYWLAAEYWVLRGAHRVLFTTEQEASLAKQSFWLHRWRPQVVSFGAVRPPGAGEALREAYFAAFPAMRGRRFLLFLGRIHRKKGCDLLVEAFARHAAQDPALHLVLAGPDDTQWGDELRTLAAQGGVADRVHWPGMLTGDVKWGAFYASEAFVLPSHQENFGIAVAEALACGKPVLLSDKINIAAEIQADGAGWMEEDTPAGTDRLLAHWLSASTETRARMSAQALATFEARYNMERNAAFTLRLFAQPEPRQSGETRR